MNWDDPQARLALIEAVGPKEYNRRFAQQRRESTVKTVNGYGIRIASSRFGQLYAVDGTVRAFSELAQAEAYAKSLPPSKHT